MRRERRLVDDLDRPTSLVPDAAKFVARHQVLARRVEARRNAGDVARHQHRLMLVPVIRKPCTTSALVARNVIGVSVGTRMHCGVNEYCWPTARTVTEPSGFERAAEIAFDELAAEMQRASDRRSRPGLRHRA
jgi:hypothetical protein